jgi:N-acetyl-gamma-glutamyl-phosphate reductase
VGTNYADIHVAARGHVVLVTVAIDNLVKGASGQAVQNMNLALGLDEGLGLGFRGYYP